MRDSSLSWQKKLAQGFSSASELLTFLELPKQATSMAELQFPSRIPLGFARRMQKANLNDPLLLQVLALDTELSDTVGYVPDPLAEAKSNVQKGIIHKYHGRVLLTLTGVCAVNCRYCFRRHFPYAENNLSTAEWEQALDYIRQDSSINEVIYSGGDPLAANDRRIAWLTRQIADIPHIKRLRVHTRLPVVIPQRVTDGLIEALSATRLPVTMVLHCNHANEVDAQMLAATQKLKSANITLLNQAVLLRGVNNRLEDQMALSEVLGDNGVLPYYLHLLDHVRGASHFHCSDAEAKHLVGQLLTRLPGYLVPRLVREIAGEAGKVPIHVDLITS